MRTSIFSIAFASLLTAAASAAQSWIWLSPQAKDGERAIFRKTFELPADFKGAELLLSCDNGAKAQINGTEVANCPDWSSPVKANVRTALKAGANELLIAAKNNEGVAALTARLKIKLADGKDLTIETDGSWEASAPEPRAWKPATIIAAYGKGPWGDVFATGGGAKGGSGTATDPAEIKVLPGFKAELLYTVPKAEQGSWVSLTVDPKGRLVACAQQGGLYRITVGAKPEDTKVEKLDTKVGGAHGLLFAFDSLYVMVNEQGGKGGLWRLRDTNGDDQFDQEELLRKMDGGGEHGPHAVKLSPDGKSLFIMSGNHTKLPDKMELSRAAMAWDEDHIVERMWDAGGHAVGVMAPGGYICKTDPDGKTFELYSYGYRNAFGMAFNWLGDLFAYDSDMEWDAGAPWYRPTRICMAPSGSDLGWRSGAGKWPTYYPDSLPGVNDVGPGSPTGVTNGAGAKFPAKYQRAIYAADWTYGTMYALHLTPSGASYKAEREEFVSGKPLPLTDLVVRPQDGALYFAIGGRGTQSALYRVSYTGSESTAAALAPAMTPEHKLRRELEKLHESGTGPDALAKAWPYLGHADRFLRWAARTAIERQSAPLWAEKALAEKDTQAFLEAAVALARIGDKSHQPRLLDRLNAHDFAKLTLDQQLALVRIYQLAVIRMGQPSGASRDAAIARLDALYPAKNNDLNRELAQLLVALDAPKAVAKTVQLMATARDEQVDFVATDAVLARNDGYARGFASAAASSPNRQQIALAYALRVAKTGWTPETRKTFFAWFPRTAPWQGGNSFKKFIENMRKQALGNVADEAERKTLDELSAKKEAPAIAAARAPKGPGRNWSIDDVVKLAGTKITGRDFENGKAMFTSTACATCHRFAGEGGGLGPDLTASGSRYSLRDLLENITDPSKIISDQYESHEIALKDGSTVIGRVITEEGGKLMVAQNPFAVTDLTAIEQSKVAGKKAYAVSMMPPGLINSLNPGELLDLIAYVQSGGNANDAAFKK